MCLFGLVSTVTSYDARRFTSHAATTPLMLAGYCYGVRGRQPGECSCVVLVMCFIVDCLLRDVWWMTIQCILRWPTAKERTYNKILKSRLTEGALYSTVQYCCHHAVGERNFSAFRGEVVWFRTRPLQGRGCCCTRRVISCFAILQLSFVYTLVFYVVGFASAL